MSPKLVDKEQRQREIAIAALELFAERGFEATSIEQIAAAAGVSKGTIYLYFESKEQLTVAAASAWVEGIEAQVAPLLEDTGDPLSRLLTLFEASTRAFLGDPRIIALFLGIGQFVLRNPELVEGLDPVRRVSAPIREAIRRILVDGVAAGVFRPEVEEEAERIAINLVAFVDGLGLHFVTNPGFFDLSEQVELYVQGLLSSLRVEPSGEDTGVNDA